MSVAAISTESIAAQGAGAAATAPPKLDLGKVGTPKWANLLESQGSSSGLPTVSRISMKGAVELALTEKLINFEQADYLNNAINEIPASVRPNEAQAVQLLEDIGLDVSRVLTFTPDGKGSAVVSQVEVGFDQNPNWTNLLKIETDGSNVVHRQDMMRAVESANEKGLIGPKQTAYIKDAIEQLDTSSATTVDTAKAQLTAIGHVITKPVDVAAINAIRTNTAVAAGASGKPNWSNLLEGVSPANPDSISRIDLSKAVESAQASNAINGEQAEYLSKAVQQMPLAVRPNLAQAAQLMDAIGLDVKKPVQFTPGTTGLTVVSHVDVGRDQEPKWANLLAVETSGSKQVSRMQMTKTVESANEKGLIGPKQTAYLKGAIEKLDTTATSATAAAAQLNAIGLVVTKEVDIEAINKIAKTTL